MLPRNPRSLPTSSIRPGNIWPPPRCSPTSTATSVRVRDGKRLVTDGPFAETREQLGGYFLIDAKDLDEAIAIAERIPDGAPGHRRGPAGHRETGLPTP